MTQDLNIFSRAELLLGEETLHKLRSARVALFGIGGVGSFAAEALARGGVGHITLVDGEHHQHQPPIDCPSFHCGKRKDRSHGGAYR